MRVVLDADVYIAAYIGHGLADETVKLIEGSDLELVTSPAILAQVFRNLTGKLGQSALQTRRYIDFLSREATVVSAPDSVPDAPTAFSGDEHLLACCVSANAKVLVTFDRKLLREKTFRDIGVVHPRALLWMLAGREEAA